MSKNRNRRMTTAELVAELRDFNHHVAARRLEELDRIVTRAGLCDHCGRTDCDRMTGRWDTPTTTQT